MGGVEDDVGEGPDDFVSVGDLLGEFFGAVVSVEPNRCAVFGGAYPECVLFGGEVDDDGTVLA